MGIFRNRCCSVYFYPRPPRGGRLLMMSMPIAMSAFLSTPSARRATKNTVTIVTGEDISIHALREEGDSRRLKTYTQAIQFLSTPSARRATFGYQEAWAEYRIFLSTPSARRATPPLSAGSEVRWYFYPRPPRGGRLLPVTRIRLPF